MPMNTIKALETSDIIVIKIGTALVVDGQAAVKSSWLSALAQDIKPLISLHKKIVIVSSGAVALGRKAMGIALDVPPKSIPLEKKQAASAVGQYYLFDAYHRAFQAEGLQLAQVLLTMSDTENRRMHLNARATLNALLERGIIPVINENDTISTGEIRFGDNDRLASRVAQMIEAQSVILLSTTEGLYTANPDTHPDAIHLPLIETLSEEHISMAGDAVAGLSTGGMKSKIEAAMTATRAGIHMIIANGRAEHALKAILEDITTRTTLFKAQGTDQNARKRWIGAHLRPKGTIIVDAGAITALKNGKSLLPIGVKTVKGTFERGDAVEIQTLEGKKLGLGLSAYNAADAQKIIGQNSERIAEILGYAGRSELIHRNDMALSF